MTRLYAEYCKRSYEEFERGMDRDRVMAAEEALEWDLIDRSPSFAKKKVALEPA